VGATLVAAATVTLTACTQGGQPAEPAPGRDSVVLDARGVSACSVLGESTLPRVGLDPTTSQDKSNAVASACAWDSADRRETMMLVINVSFDIDLVAGAGGTVREFRLDGHRAVQEEPPGSRICTIYAELAENQIVSAEFASSATDRPVESCAKAEQIVRGVIGSLSAR